MNLRTFIDSTVWTRYESFVHTIRDQSNAESNINTLTFNVQALLMGSLRTIIDKTEAFILVNTDNSTKENAKTLSPWIYNELGITETMRVTKPQRYQIDVLTCMERGIHIPFRRHKTISLEFPYNKDNLIDITGIQLSKAIQAYNKAPHKNHDLEYIYDQVKKR